MQGSSGLRLCYREMSKYILSVALATYSLEVGRLTVLHRVSDLFSAPHGTASRRHRYIRKER